jgi:sugar transferase EpsL
MYKGKRILDLAVAGVAAVIFLPIMVLIGFLIRLTIGAPVLFRQERPGLKGTPFVLMKFRTMSNAATSKGELLPDVDRLGKFGKFLRSTSLDELPELWNVLRGDLSIVGPRPLLMKYLQRYSSDQMRRHDVRPGITGWAQINGRNAITWEEKFDLDLWYVQHASFVLDVRIILLTAWKTLSREGISHPGQATMEEFKGSK